MVIFKCKMCGGDIRAETDAAFGACDSCGVTSTLPKANDEKIVNLFNRANHFRRLNEFDKALASYENILSEDPTNAEAHWCVVLCRYGIEYVEDPKTHQRVPTCHRAQYVAILTDADYLASLENAPDSYTKGLYESEAKKINEIQKGILAISNKEEPYDVFICYKETTDGGSRTKDSTISQDIYHQLVSEGYRVFFAKITLEDKLGQEYEPYIFNALSSAKVMLVLGTKKEHFEAVWVKNEWSRFLALMKKDRSRLLIPCYRDMDVYDMPDELSNLQAQDISKIGFMQDLTRGIKKVFDTANKADSPNISTNAPIANTSTSIENLMKRGSFLLEDREWAQAIEYFDKVLDASPEYAVAYVGKLCAELKICKQDELENIDKPLSSYSTFNRAMRFADERLRSQLEAYDLNSKKVSARIDANKKMRGKIAASAGITVAIKTDGTLVSNVKPAENKRPWGGDSNIWVATGYGEVFTLSKYGYVDSTMRGAIIGAPVTWDWKDAGIVAIAVGTTYKYSKKILPVGLKSNGTVITTERGIGFPFWDNIVAITASHEHEVGLKSDGSVMVSGGDEFRAREIRKWHNITAVAAGDDFTLGLKSDGTVLFCGKQIKELNPDGSFTLGDDVCGILTEWTDIIDIAAGSIHYAGLRKDGTVISGGARLHGVGNTSEWRNIVAIAAGEHHTVGLKDDGTVVAVGDNRNGQCNVSEWDNIGIETPMTAERLKKEDEKAEKAQKKADAAKKKVAEDKSKMEIYNQHLTWRATSLCGYCGSKTSFWGKCKQCGKTSLSWENQGKFERIKELGLSMAFVQRHREWCDKGFCYHCGWREFSLFADKCKNCEREKRSWTNAEAEIIKLYGAVYNLGFTAEEYSIEAKAAADAQSKNSAYSVGQTVFAKYQSRKYYYPGTITKVYPDKVAISFLDGDIGTARLDEVIELNTAFSSLQIEGNWKNIGTWHKGKITKTEPLTMNYDDGDIEKIMLVQLRGTLN